MIADGEVVLHHDKAIEHKQKHSHINISTLNLPQLKEILLPNETAVPTLREFLEAFSNRTAVNGKPLYFSIDLQDLKVGLSMVPILEEFGVLDRTVLCSTTTMTLKKVRQNFSNVLLVASNQEDQIKESNFGETGKIAPLNLYAFNIQGDHYKPHMREILDNYGFKCFIWDLHKEADLRKYLPFKPHAIYSNYPDLALKIRDELFPV